MQGPRFQNDNGLMLLAVLCASNQFQQALVKADLRLHVYGPFLNVKSDARQAKLAKRLLHGIAEC